MCWEIIKSHERCGVYMSLPVLRYQGGIMIKQKTISLSGKEMIPSDVIAYFDDYQFTDPIGHSLTNCVDFLELLYLAFGQKDTDLESIHGTISHSNSE